MDMLTIGNDFGFGRYVRSSPTLQSGFSWVGSFDMSVKQWLRIVRSGNTTTTFTSTNGSTWAAIGSPVTQAGIPGTAYVGFILASGQVGSAPLGYAQFDSVTLNTGSEPVVGAISSLTAATGTSSGQVVLNWSSASNATTYQIERSTEAGRGFTKIATVTAPVLSYTDNCPQLNTTYYYRVMAFNPGNNSAFSQVASAQGYNPFAPVGSVTNVLATPGAKIAEINLSWNAEPNATMYAVEVASSAAGPFYQLATVEAPRLTFTDANLPAGEYRYYRILPSNPVYTGTPSAVVSSMPFVPTSLAGWQYSTFGTTVYIPGLSGNLDAPNGDGIPNLMKYAIGIPLNDASGNPLLVPPTRMPLVGVSTVGDVDYLSLSFVHSKLATDVRTVVEVTSDLGAAWTEFDPFLPANQISRTDNFPTVGLETIVARDIQPLSNSDKRFMRLKVTDLSGVLQVVGGTQIDPAGGATVTWNNPHFNFSGSDLSSEPFEPVASVAMTPAQGATILDFEASSGFGAVPYQLNASGVLNPSPVLSTDKGLKVLSTTVGTVNAEWRSYDMATNTLGAPDATKAVYVIRDRSSGTPTMVSGTQGLLATAATGVNGGVYLTFQRHLSKFSVVINSNADNYSPLVILFDGNGLPIRRYYFGGVGWGQATYFGIASPNALIRSVWIGQNGGNPALVLDDISFVPAP